ncbi:MAG: hypothetical protein ACKO23_11685 [Gemmataceae bacterium]
MVAKMMRWVRNFLTGPSAYYFFHIPKTAGCTLVDLLEKRFSQEHICPPYYIHGMLQIPQRDLERYRLFRGHHYNLLFRVLPFRVKTFAFLRDPIERSLSHYEQIRRTPDHYFHQRVKEQGSFLAFLRDPETRPMVENFQTRSLLWDENPYQLAARFSPEQIQKWSMEKWLETRLLDHFSPREMLARAKSRLESFGYVGFTEDFEGCMKRMFHRFGWGPMPAIASQNVSGSRVKKHDLKAEELRLLEEVTAVDRDLYDHCRKLAA